MIRFTVQTLLKNKVLWAWPGLILLFVATVLIWGDISSAQNSHSFFILFGDLKMPAGMFADQFLVSFIILIAIIGMPSHLAQNLKPERASLLLSKPISRTEMFFSDFAGMLVTSIFYTFITIILLAILVGIEAAIFPYQFFLGLLIFLPLILLAFYITISLFLVISNSYLAGVILGYFFTSFSALFLDIDKFLKSLGWEDTFAEILITSFSYIVPSAGGFQQIMHTIFVEGFSSIDGGLLTFSLSTCLTFGLLSYYFFRKKQF